MQPNKSRQVVESIENLFTHYKLCGDYILEQIQHHHINWHPSANSRGIAAIVLNLNANVVGTFNNLLLKEPTRASQRIYNSVKPEYASKTTIIMAWSTGWSNLFTALHGLNDDDLTKFVFGENYNKTILNLLHAELAFCSSQIGQMIYVQKMLNDKSMDDERQAILEPERNTKKKTPLIKIIRKFLDKE